MYRPSYIRLYESGELAERIKILQDALEDCALCPRHCHVNRTEGELGICRVGLDVPLVYNCGGYEEVATLKVLDGIFDRDHPPLDRMITSEEFAEAVRAAQEEGLIRLDGVTV